MALYQYTILKTDGTIEELAPSPKKDFKELYKIIGCETIELVPKPFHPGWIKGYRTIFADESGRLNGKAPNRNMTVAYDEIFQEAVYIVGDVVLEQKIKEKK